MLKHFFRFSIVLAFFVFIINKNIATASIFEPAFWDNRYFIDVSELKPGMKGYGKTVVSGTKIEQINCEIIEIMPASGFDQNTKILCHVSGDLIDRTNGISGGMSGSPVYFDNRLAGAMSGAYFFTDSRTIMVTPIKNMLSVFNTNDPRFNPFKPAPPFNKFDTVNINWQPTRHYTDYFASNPISTVFYSCNGIELQGKKFTKIAIAPTRELARVAYLNNPNTAVFVQCSTPRCYLGLNETEAKLVDETINRFNAQGLEEREIIVIPDKFQPQSTTLQTSNSTVMEYYPLNVKGPTSVEPGSTLGIKYIHGFFSSYTYGTITYIDGNNNFLGFGHPSDRVGPLSGAVALAYMLVSPPNNRRNDKRGIILNDIGSWYQDRGPAIAGTFGVKPDFFPVRVSVKDIDSKKELNIPLEVIADISTYPGYVAGAVTGGVSRATGRYRDVIVEWQFNVKFRGLDDTYSRTNYYWFESSPAPISNELGRFLSIASQNEFKRLIPEKVECVGLIRKGKKLLRIGEIKFITAKNLAANNLPIKTKLDKLPEKLPTIEVKNEKVTINRKDNVYILVKLIPYRSQSYWLIFPLEFYKGKAGNYQLQLFGGGKWTVDDIIVGNSEANRIRQAMNRTVEVPLDKKPTNVQEMLNTILQTPRNDELIIQTVYSDQPSKIGLTTIDSMPVNRLTFLQDGIVIGAKLINVDYQNK